MAWHNLEKKRFSPHDIRDLTQSALESSGANSNVISRILAHKVKGVDSQYSAHFEDELLQVYKHALPWLMPTTKAEIKQETDDIRAKYDELEEKFMIQLGEKQKETLKAIVEMLKLKGIKANFEEG